jgi:hypothetical protein
VTPRSWLRSLGFTVCGILVALLALELLFRVLPVSTSTSVGYYIDPLILTYPPGHTFTTSTGWSLQRAQRHHANNFGFVADHDFVRNPEAVALIGDSFVEASMLPPPERLAAQLERSLGTRPVYAMGAPGTALLDYAERLRFASEHFAVRDFVLLLEHGDIAQSLCGSGNVNAQCLDRKTLEPRIEKLPSPGAAKKALRELALPQYLFSQLQLDPARWAATLFSRARTPPPASGSAPASPPAASRSAPGSAPGSASASVPASAPVSVRDPSAISPEAIDRVLQEFFVRVKPYRDGGKLILILMGDAKAGDPVRDKLIAAANGNGAEVFLTGPPLRNLTDRTGLSMHVSPRDPHMNGVALGIIAAGVAPLLNP